MTGSKTATIETLTAEVRVLMVGSRQVTASVYGQLDVVADAGLAPFGRVTPKEGDPGYVYVVGKRASTGDLARSLVPVSAAGIERWVRARSAADAYNRSAADLESAAKRHEDSARSCEAEAARLDSDAYGGISYFDSAAAAAEAEADCGERAAAAAAGTERLKALADAARNRHSAAKNRENAATARAEAEAKRAEAAEHLRTAAACRADAVAFRDASAECTEKDQAECERLAIVAAGWLALPLIVLAGLR